MKRNKIIIKILFIIVIFFFISMIKPAATAQPSIVVKGYVYVDGIIIQTEEVRLRFYDKTKYSTPSGDGQYFFNFSDKESGEIAKFLVIYNGDSYIPPQILTIEENQYIYNINLSINTSGGGQPPEDPTNIKPEANASGPYYGTVNIEINFDGSESYDSDGSIIKYEWDFGDGTTKTGETQTHTYDESDTYRVTLTVTDNNGTTDVNITYAYITETQNTPPDKLIISGRTNGSVNSEINFTFTSTDYDNDTIQYIIDWGDETDITSSHFYANSTTYYANHSWIYPGIYKLMAYARDENNANSQASELIIFIDSIYCEDIGYMTDYTNDNIYDLFFSNNSGEETPVEQINEIYLIDDDNDGEFEYQFNITTLEVSKYAQVDSNEQKTSDLIDLITPILPYIFIGIIILLILIIANLTYQITRKTEKKKVKNIDENNKVKPNEIMKIKDKESPVNSEDDKNKKIEDEIDEILAKKNK